MGTWAAVLNPICRLCAWPHATLCFGGLVGPGRVGLVYVDLLMLAPKVIAFCPWFLYGLRGYRNMGLTYEHWVLKFNMSGQFLPMLRWQPLCLKCRLHPFRPCRLFPSLIFCWISHGRMTPTSWFPVAVTSGLSSGILTTTRTNGCAARMGNRGNVVSNPFTDLFPLAMHHACLHRGLPLFFARAQGPQHLRGWFMSTSTRKSILTLGGSTTSGGGIPFSKWRRARAVEPAQVIFQMMCQWLQPVLAPTKRQRARMIPIMMKVTMVSKLFVRYTVARLRRVPCEYLIGNSHSGCFNLEVFERREEKKSWMWQGGVSKSRNQ